MSSALLLNFQSSSPMQLQSTNHKVKLILPSKLISHVEPLRQDKFTSHSRAVKISTIYT